MLLLTTEQQVHAFDLTNRLRIALGRHDANDLQLVSRTVSNFHAELLHDEGRLVLRDLESTNGTFVNDEAVHESELQPGDRIRLGNHVLTVHVEQRNGDEDGFFRLKRQPDYFDVGVKGNIISLRAGMQKTVQTLRAADPHDLSLADLLKILTTGSRSITLALRKGPDDGHIYIRKDKIVHAEYGMARGEKALYRFFGWQKAEYEIQEFPASPAVPRTIALPADTLIVEGMKQIEELAKLITQLPPLEVPLLLKEDCSLPVSAHSSAEIQIYQDIIRHETIAKVLEDSTLTDCRALRLIHALIRKGVFAVSEVSDYSLEDTIVYRPK
jgi:hypothetical protein